MPCFKLVHPMIVTIMAGMAPLQATDWYVSTTGSASNSGRTIDKPFAAIQQAADSAKAGDVVFVRGGTYRETVTPKNSGTSGAPITFQPYTGESVTISGAEPVVGWSQHSGSIYKATLAGGFMDSSHNQSDQIFVDGKMMNIARWPNCPLVNDAADVSHPAKSTITTFTIKSRSGNVTTAQFSDVNLPPGNYAGAEIYMQPNFNAWSWTLCGKVAAVNGTGITMTSFNDNGVDGNGAQYALGSRYFLYNTLSLLDTAGEWYHDKAANLLYVWCPANANPSTRTVEAKKREYAFNLSNKSFVTVKGFNLFACAITTDDAAGGDNRGYDAAGTTRYPWRSAGSVAASSYCIIDGIQAKYVSHYTDVSGHFAYQWGQSSGMVMGGSGHTIENCLIQYSAGNGITMMGKNGRVTNNTVYDCDYMSTDCAGINTGGVCTSVDHRISYNTISRTGRSGVGCRILANSGPDNFAARIDHNDISFFMLQDWDGGGTYCAYENKNFLRFDHNRIHDGTGYTVAGIYLDYCKNFILDHNVIWNVEWAIRLQSSINTSGVTNALCYNNTLVVKNTSAVPYGPFNFAGTVNAAQGGTIAQNNICLYRDNLGTAATSGYNAFSGAYSNAMKTTNLLHPTDPQFVDFVGGNFQLQSASPAVNTGTLMTSVVREGLSVPVFNDRTIGTVDIGAYEYGATPWTAGATSASVAATGIDVTPSLDTTIMTRPLTLAYQIIPDNATNQSVTWSSANLLVATVDASGIVTPVAVGSTAISATSSDGGFTDHCIVTVRQPIVGERVVAIECGGSDYISTSGILYRTDIYFTGGSNGWNGDWFKNFLDGQNVADEQIYRTSRWGSDFTYKIPVPNNVNYNAVLQMATGYGQGGLLDVYAEGTKVISSFDVWAATGNKNVTAYDSTLVNLAVSDGFLDLEFKAVNSSSSVSVNGIQVIAASSGPTTASLRSLTKPSRPDISFRNNVCLVHVPGGQPYHVIVCTLDGKRIITLSGSLERTFEIGHEQLGAAGVYLMGVENGGKRNVQRLIAVR